jgi:peptidoglycan/LPS O-acetylase OafA/YrhL
MSPRQEGLLESGHWDVNQKEGFLRTAQNTAKWTLEALRPSVMARPGMRKQLKGTAYLDGLRGFAAFIVYWHHHQLWPRQLAGQVFESGWGFNDKYFFVALPGIRTFFTGGHFAVSVFFVISGYVLSAKPLSLIYAGEHTKLGDSLASALFRRWLRLFLPVIGVSFVYMTMWHLFGIWVIAPKQQSNYHDELWNWYMEFKNFSFIFRQGGDPWFTYGYHTWSIPVEFRGSVIIYTSLLAFSRATRNARLWCQLGLILYFLYVVDGWFGALFTAGMLLCELDILSKANKLPQFLVNLTPYKMPLFYTLLLASFFLSGVPSFSRETKDLLETPGWYYLSFLVPQAAWDQKWFFLFWAAIFFVAAIPRIAWLKAFFETSFNQYLGRISFALYLVHGPVLWTLGDRLYVATGWFKDDHLQYIPWWINAFPLSQKGPLGLELSFLAPHLILLPLTLWVAEVVTKVFDEPSVRFSQWAYEKTLPSPASPAI